MVEHVSTTADEPGEDPAPRATWDELAAEPERVASEAATRPVRIDGPNGEALVLVDAAAFDQLRAGRSRAVLASDLPVEKTERMLAAPIPDSCKALDDLVPDGWLDGQEKLLGIRR